MKLLDVGPSYGYFAEPSKSLLVVKEDQLNEAKNVFSDLNVEITLGGRFLGGVIGDSTEAQQYVADKVTRWVQAVERLSIAAKNFRQSAYSAFTHSLVNEWTYLQRVFESGENEYIPLRNSIREFFSPAILGREVLEADHDLLALPVKKGGLALSDPVQTTKASFNTSKLATKVLQEAIKTGEELNVAAHNSLS